MAESRIMLTSISLHYSFFNQLCNHAHNLMERFSLCLGQPLIFSRFLQRESNYYATSTLIHQSTRLRDPDYCGDLRRVQRV